MDSNTSLTTTNVDQLKLRKYWFSNSNCVSTALTYEALKADLITYRANSISGLNGLKTQRCNSVLQVQHKGKA